jgi:hypothetical protein
LRLKALIAAELTVFGRGRLSLEGFGLITINHKGSERSVMAVRSALPEPLKSHAEAYVQYVFKAIRAHRAISDKESGMIDLTDESIWTWMANQQGRSITRERNAFHGFAQEDGQSLRNRDRRSRLPGCPRRLLEISREPTLDDGASRRRSGPQARSELHRPARDRRASLSMCILRGTQPVRHGRGLSIHGL